MTYRYANPTALTVLQYSIHTYGLVRGLVSFVHSRILPAMPEPPHSKDAKLWASYRNDLAAYSDKYGVQID